MPLRGDEILHDCPIIPHVRYRKVQGEKVQLRQKPLTVLFTAPLLGLALLSVCASTPPAPAPVSPVDQALSQFRVMDVLARVTSQLPPGGSVDVMPGLIRMEGE